MFVSEILYRVAFIVTGFIHLYFNDLIRGALMVATLCLSDSKRSIVQSILRLHSVVLVGFMLAFCFGTVSAYPNQMRLGGSRDTLSFDDMDVPNGFAALPAGYHGLTFDDFFAFEPTHPSLEGIISTKDLDCAVSKPNALYGSKINEDNPSIHARNTSHMFTVHALKIKPLDFPVGSVTINLCGTSANTTQDPLAWSVEFPVGFHDVLHVRLEEFSRVRWAALSKLEVWATFRFRNYETDDWEFCIDDLEIEVE